MENLISILETRREHNSVGEQAFIDKYILPLNAQPMTNPEGEVLAYVVDNTHGSSTVLWSAHIDTMHRDKGRTSDMLSQEVWVDEEGTAFVTDHSDCLGADDGAGMWLMFEMIMADVAGTYIFHRGEEKGCWGSGEMAIHHRDWLSKFTHAIAFDRRGTTSIITHQRSERACSDALGNQLISLFNMRFELDNTGVYTDTAEYMSIIPECVNVSIGYQSEHSNKETLDTGFVLALRDAVCALDWDSITLVVERDHTKAEYLDYGSSVYGGWNTYSGKSFTGAGLSEYEVPSVERILSTSSRALAEWVAKADPEDVAFLLHDLADQLEEAHYAMNDMYEDDHSNHYLKAGMQ